MRAVLTSIAVVVLANVAMVVANSSVPPPPPPPSGSIPPPPPPSGSAPPPPPPGPVNGQSPIDHAEASFMVVTSQASSSIEKEFVFGCENDQCAYSVDAGETWLVFHKEHKLTTGVHKVMGYNSAENYIIIRTSETAPGMKYAKAHLPSENETLWHPEFTFIGDDFNSLPNVDILPKPKTQGVPYHPSIGDRFTGTYDYGQGPFIFGGTELGLHKILVSDPDIEKNKWSLIATWETCQCSAADPNDPNFVAPP
eukprot:Nk52_evm42s223 gene=Nk52_evmTU42s223